MRDAKPTVLMSFDPQHLDRRLRELAGDGALPARYLVAFSGGIDSVVLLHALREVAGATPIIALHVDHGLHQASRSWDRRCAAFAQSLGVAYRSRRIAVDDRLGGGLEAAARSARYAYFEAQTAPGDWLLSAHHEDDQAETLLLNLLRGSGVLGLAGIAVTRSCGAGTLVRPLLDVSRAAIEAYARRRGLDWVEDPSNRDTRFDRNFLRTEVLPRLQTRWPAAARTLRRSAELASEASELLDELAAHDLARTGRPHRLATADLAALIPARQRNLLRFAARSLGLPAPPAAQLKEILTTLLAAREDARPLVTWPGAEVRRYREHIYLLPAAQPAEPIGAALTPATIVALGPGAGRLRLEATADVGIDPAVAEGGLTVAFREGGERLRLQRGGPSKRLKTLLQDAGVVPWMRSRIPLLMADDCLVAVGDLWIDAAYRAAPGYLVRWDDRPALD